MARVLPWPDARRAAARREVAMSLAGSGSARDWVAALLSRRGED
jgi:hypothetical protein